ncbi:MAG: BNR-4 repeat-containing protein [Verrucomicrobia bacterium]|nr:BNR-4 repeat-containing protein [Verrucomicrobiota bacterium]
MPEIHRKRWSAGVCGLAVLLACGPAGARTYAPYQPDGPTLHLWHLDETSAPAADSVVGGLPMQGLSGGASLGAAGPAGFGTALLANSGTNTGGILLAAPALANGAGDNVAFTHADPSGGAFTFEAIVRIANAAVLSGTSGNLMEILSMEGDGSADRVFQFRLVGRTTAAGPRLEFANLRTGTGAQAAISVNLPVSGAHVPNATGWFHVAVTYSGAENTADNLRFYWTSLQSGATRAAMLGTGTMIADLQTVAADFAIGNEARNTGGQTEGFGGTIDEVRISGIARAPDQFVFSPIPAGGLPGADTDSDGLPDYWEEWIAAASETDAITGISGVLPGDDFDGDGLTNQQEYAYGTDPVLSDAGDSDGDGLADFWEWFYLDGLSYGAFDDPDGDGKTNLSEAVAGTDPADGSSFPAWVAPRVALLRDSVVTGDACLMPSGTYGQAINGISFQDQILLAFGGYQYTAWYDTTGSVQRICLGRRAIAGTAAGPWEICRTNSEFLNGDETAWDAHDVVAIGICPNDGTLHIAWDLHGNTLRYRRSVAGLCTTNKGAWVAGELGTGTTMLLAEQNWLTAAGATETSVTYPQFIAGPDGNLTLNRRNGASGNGDQMIQRYTAGAGWSAGVQFINRAGTYTGPDYNGTATTSTARCAYLNGMDYGPDGKLHVTWTWRENAGGSNHDICYAYSEDQGITWKNNAGSVVADTSAGGRMDLSTTGITVKPLDMRQLLINQQAQCVDADGRVHVLMMHRRQDPGYGPEVFKDDFSTKFTTYYHYFRDPVSGTWFQRRIPPEAANPGSRPKIGYDAAGNLYAAFLSYADGTAVTPGYTHGKLVIAAASKASLFTDWEVLYRGTTGFNGEPVIDSARLLADGILSVYIQEHSDAVSTNGIPTPLHVLDFAANVPEPATTTPTLAFFGGDVVICLRGSAGTTYQLQTSPDLSEPWTSVGTPAAGADAILAFPHAGGALDPRRFYRIVASPPP